MRGLLPIGNFSKGFLRYVLFIVICFLGSISWGQCLSEDFSSIKVGDNTTTSGSSTAWDGSGGAITWTVNKAYKAGDAVRIGSGSNVGSIQASFTPSSSTVKVSVDVKGWSSVEGDLKITLGSQSQTLSYSATMSSSFETITYTFTGVPTGSPITLKFETTAKRAFLDNVIVDCLSSTTHDVIFNANGGTGTMPNQTIAEGTTTNLTTNAFTNSGYSFAGWSTTPTGSVVYADGASYTVGTSDETLYAQWSALPAGPCISEGFDGGTTAPSGWTYAGIGGTYTTSGNYGASSPSLKMDDNNDQIVTSSLSGTASELSFWLKGNGTSGSSALLIEGWNGTAWVTIDNINPIPTGGTTITYNSSTSPALPAGIKQFRFTYTKDNGNLAFDDVKVICTDITINTPTISGNNFSVSCGSSASATVSFTTSGTFHAGNHFTVEISDATGDYSNPIEIGSITLASDETDPSKTITVSLNGGLPTGTGYRIRVTSDNPAFTSNDNGTDISITNTAPCTITTNSISSSTYSSSCSAGVSGSINITATGTFDTNNTFYVELSDASGSFTGSTVIGSLDASSPITFPLTINFSIPSGTTTSSNYKIRVRSSDIPIIGDETSVSITLSDGPCTMTPPYMTSLLYDACAASCSEGEGEIAFANSGSYSVNVTTGNIDLIYTSGSSYNLLGTIVNNPTTTAAINTNAGCTLLIDAYGTTIPPNSHILLLPSGVCPDGFGWDGLCGNAPFYVVYGQSGTSGDTWHTGGNFGNNNNGLKTFNLNFKTTDGTTHNIGYSYDGGAGDGGYAVFANNPPGGHSVSQTVLTDCRLDVGVLPVELISFTGTSKNRQVYLNWKVGSEKNNAYYTVRRSVDGIHFEEVGQVAGVGNSSTPLSYSLIDYHPNAGINYYQLFSTDFDGKTYNKGVISVIVKQESIVYNQMTEQIVFPKVGNYALINVSGQRIAEINNQSNYPFNASGLYMVLDEATGMVTKIVIP